MKVASSLPARKWRTWNAMPSADRIAFLEALVLLAVARVVVAGGLRVFGEGLFRLAASDAPVPSFPVQRQVRRSIFLATKNVPWSSLCLPNAIAGKLMLARRGFASTIHLGVGEHDTGDLHAHAWLEAGGSVVLGEKGMEIVTQITPRHSTRSPVA